MEINKIKNDIIIKHGPQAIYEITIKEISTGDIKYQQKGFGGLFCTFEKILSFKSGILEGQHQLVGWGHPMVQFYALERLQEFIRKNRDTFVAAIKDIDTSSNDIETLEKAFKRWHNKT